MKGAKRGSQEQESTSCKSSTKGERPGSYVCAGGVRGRMRESARARARVRAQDVREITSILAAWELGGEREREHSVELVLWMSELQRCFNLGTAAPGAAPQRPTNYERVVSEEK